MPPVQGLPVEVTPLPARSHFLRRRRVYNRYLDLIVFLGQTSLSRYAPGAGLFADVTLHSHAIFAILNRQSHMQLKM